MAESMETLPAAELPLGTAQPVFNEAITRIDPTGFNEQMYDYKTVNSSNFMLKFPKYAEYNPCVFTLQNSAAENYTETTINIYISNATEREESGTTYYQGISPLTNTSARNETPPPPGASNASVLGSSMASIGRGPDCFYVFAGIVMCKSIMYVVPRVSLTTNDKQYCW
ncbi:MAG: hypothetical protein Q9199_006655 [Rusavskia elegans]